MKIVSARGVPSQVRPSKYSRTGCREHLSIASATASTIFETFAIV